MPEDALRRIFQMQAKFNKKFIDPKKMTKKEKILWTMKIKTAMDCEMAELMEQIQYKWWKKYGKKEIDLIEAKYEVVDLFHFLVSIALVWGITAEELMALYNAKMHENISRQKRSY